MYKVIINEYTYWYNELTEACDRFCLTLERFNVLPFALLGEFKKTGFANKNLKIKRYCLSIEFPKLYLEIYKLDKEELLPDLLLYTLKKYMEKYYDKL